MNYQELTQKAHSNAENHGFWDERKSNEHYLMLICTEVSELVEADRNSRNADMVNYNKLIEIGVTFEEAFVLYVKDGIEDELADVVIRLFDLAGALGVQWDKMQPCRYFRDYTKFDLCENAFGLVKGLSNGLIPIEKRIQFGVEYAMSWSNMLEIDLDSFVEMKMKFNATRIPIHGKKY